MCVGFCNRIGVFFFNTLSALAHEATLLFRDPELVGREGGGFASGVRRCVCDVLLLLQSTGDTPLIVASYNGKKEVVELLLERKANLEAKDNLYGACVIRKTHRKHRHHGHTLHINGSYRTSHITHHTHRITHLTPHISYPISVVKATCHISHVVSHS